MRRLSLLLMVLVLAAGCRSTSSNDSEAKDLVAVPTAKNIAILTSGMNKDDFDRQESVEIIAALKETLAGLGASAAFEIREFQELTKAELMTETKRALKDVGTDGTLFWYVTTHGWSDGFSMKEGRVRADDLAAVLKQGRAGMPPMKRLYMFFDYCGSGGLVDGMQLKDAPARTAGGAKRPGTALNLGQAPAATLSKLKAGSQETLAGLVAELTASLVQPAGLALAGEQPSLPYRQALFLAPATKTQETLGPTLTWTMNDVIERNKDNAAFTIGEFVRETAAGISEWETEDFFGDGDDDFEMAAQTAVFRTLPNDDLLADRLFHAVTATGP